MRKNIAAIAILFLLGNAGAQEAAVISLNYESLENMTNEKSSQLKAVEYDLKSLEAKEFSQKSQLRPRLSLDGYYKYNTVVPEIEFSFPVNGSKKLGDNANYSFGPSFSWVVWDKNGISKNLESLKANTDSKRYEVETLKRQLSFECAKIYFQLALLSEQAALYSDSLALAEKQYKDILINVRAGTKSRKDELFSHTEYLSRKRQLENAKSEFCSMLRELGNVTGYLFPAETYLPENIKLDSLDDLLVKFKKYQFSKLWDKHPGVMFFDELLKSAKYARESILTGLWPKLTVALRSSFDYPNGPKTESFNQNSAAINFSMPIYESGQSRLKASEYENISRSAEERKSQKQDDLRQLWFQTKDSLNNLLKQYEINEQTIKECEELSQIVYKSYASGSATYLEVENTNYRLLEVKVQQAKTKVQMLVQYAVLKSLAE